VCKKKADWEKKDYSDINARKLGKVTRLCGKILDLRTQQNVGN